MIKAFLRGNPCYYNKEFNEWRYLDGMPIGKEIRPCAKCGKLPTPEGYDACLGYIEGAKAACCGHGVSEGYIWL